MSVSYKKQKAGTGTFGTGLSYLPLYSFLGVHHAIMAIANSLHQRTLIAPILHFANINTFI